MSMVRGVWERLNPWADDINLFSFVIHALCPWESFKVGLTFEAQPRGCIHNALFIRNLLVGLINQSVCPRQTFGAQCNVTKKLFHETCYEKKFIRIIVDMHLACLWLILEPTGVKHLSGVTQQGRLQALPTNIRLNWKGLPVTNTLAHYEHL